MAEDRWLGTHEAALRLGIAESELYRLIDLAILPSYKSGRTIWLERTDVEDFIARSGPADPPENPPDGTNGAGD